MTPNQSFIAALATIVFGLVGLSVGVLLIDKWEARQRAKSKQKP